LCLPSGTRPYPAVLIVGGTLSHTRDGEFYCPNRPWIPHRTALKNLAWRLADGGFASLRYDVRAHAAPEEQAEDVRKSFDAFASCQDVDPQRLCAAGESAGAYYTCLAAANGMSLACYVLMGALHSSVEDLYQQNYGRVRDYAMSRPERKEWVMRMAPYELAVGLNYKQMIKSAYDGARSKIISNGRNTYDVPLKTLQYELTHPPAALFKHLRAPVLVVQGSEDMNVPVEDAFAIEESLRESGNTAVTVRLIEGVDHSFQETAATPEERMRERISLGSFARPYAEDFYETVTTYLSETLNTDESPVGAARIAEPA